MKQIASIALLGGILALSAATAMSAPIVERSGRTFHIKACPATEGPYSARCFAHIVTDAAGNILMSNASRNVTPAGYSPSQLQAAYGISPAPCGTPTTCGTGATVAIVDAYGYTNAASDLAVYRSQFGLGTASLKIVNQTGGTKLPKSNTGWDQEQALDLDMVSTMCPNCKILLVQATSASDANLGTAVNTAASMGAHVISNSYGGGEGGTSSYEADYNHAGVAVIASAGDSGYGAQFPATSPHVIAAGGTTLTLSGTTRVSETVWSGTGSGCSTVYNEPTWQLPPPPAGTNTNPNMAINTLCKMRMETDVSADADPNTGVAVYGPGNNGRSGWLVFGGTSVASPLIGGIFGEKNNAVSYASGLYAASASDFNDITSGSNGSCGDTYFCTAETGYDGPTGLGTPHGDNAF